MNEYKKILIVRTDRIGDVILSIPMAKEIKKQYPNSKITFLVRSYTAPLMKDHPFIDKVIELKTDKNDNTRLIENQKLIKKENFDVAFTVNAKPKLALLLFLCGIKQRIGTGYRWYSFMFNDKIFVRRKSGSKHELEYNIDMLEKIGIKNSYDDISFDLNVSREVKEKVEKISRDSGININKPVVALHPGSGGSAIDLPVKKMKELSERLSQDSRINFCLTGSETEKKLIEEVQAQGSINLAGMFNLEEFVAFLANSNLLIANSTGPIHIAAAVNKDVVGFYPKIHSASPKRWGPYTAKSKIFQPNLKCTNCTRKQCEELDCMSTIEVDDVLEHIDQLIEKYSSKESNEN